MVRTIFSLGAALLLLSAAAAAQNSPVTIQVDAKADRRPISPYIYGVSLASPAALADLNVPLNRQGGNNTSRYNWQINADNRGSDWYFQSIGDASATAGERGDTFIANTKTAGAQAMLTIPTVGWVARLGPGRAKRCSFSIAKYGPQTDNDKRWFPDAGNGISAITGQPITGNDPNDASVPADAAFQRGWVEHLVSKWGRAAQGGLRYYILDNEPSIWHATHRDVHPTGATMEEVRDKILDYAAMIKAVDPGALVVGPEEWGWSGYLYSGYDQQYGNKYGWSKPLPDRTAHGNQDYLPWLLDQLRQHHNRTGRRLLDVFSVHYYPQGGEFSNDTSAAMQLRRNRSTRSLWDPNYKDETWINDRVQLIPRLRRWVNTYYPGTAIAVTEYNWGAEGHINGATAQADILGIFGREGLDMAARWATPRSDTPTYKAIQMYRNYDGQRSTFGETSVRTTAPDPDTLSAFAAERASDRALTIMVISKYLSGDTPVTIQLANFVPKGEAQVWQLTEANVIRRLPDIRLEGSRLTTTLPRQSITLFVIPADATGTVRAIVRDRNRRPLPDAEVHLFDIDRRRFLPEMALTGADGTATIEHVPPGRYHIGAYKPGYNAWIFSPGFAGWRVEADTVLGPIEITLHPVGPLPAGVAGFARLFTPRGVYPLGAGVRIDIYDGGRLVASTITDADGRYRVTHLKAITNWWGWYTYIATWADGRGVERRAVGVNFRTLGGTVLRMDIVFVL